MTNQSNIIDIGRDFSRYPAGRFISDGPYCGEIFRDKFLVPVLDMQGKTTIELDNTAGYGSSFLEEAFGGLVRLGFTVRQVRDAFNLHSEDNSLIEEIQEYIEDAGHE
ncbi:hypothetical protein SAMN02949497_1707 [Methylomagnum ishizawai]|uniref:DUF4325 domain-containing protein n=1 Tax=Methylomagnum ishizawai TaxID=1760988 RepID=A0A1Y6D0N1_9GAMM|nr:DUF4325 domain-containing protein [Methylomagnum ishizawai]SMF94393.1 hypothetical protein SAMN02949497_1707 [Methylomagnum ishizawai]